MIVRVASQWSFYFDLCSAEGAVGGRTGRVSDFSLNPLCDAVLVEQMVAWGLTYHGTRRKIFYTNRTTVLVILVL